MAAEAASATQPGAPEWDTSVEGAVVEAAPPLVEVLTAPETLALAGPVGVPVPLEELEETVGLAGTPVLAGTVELSDMV